MALLAGSPAREGIRSNTEILDNNAAPMNPAKNLLLHRSFPRNRVTGAQEPRHLLSYVRNALLLCYRLCILCNDSKICKKTFETKAVPPTSRLFAQTEGEDHAADVAGLSPRTPSRSRRRSKCKSKIENN